MRVLIDYRSALRSRSGVGEYTHELVASLARRFPPGPPGADARVLDLTVFSSSWKDRLQVSSDLEGVVTVDRRVPVALLNFLWHRLGWPSAEWLAGAPFDVTHSLHPLVMPASRAAQVITVHDLNFLKAPERTVREIHRDYPALARKHAHSADHIIVNSRFTQGEVESTLGVAADRISVCPPGAPAWPARASAPADGYILFFGTLEPRKNVGALLDAYEALLSGPRVPDLVLAGAPTGHAQAWLARIARAPLAGRVRHVGYVEPDHRRTLYEGATLLVQPSFEEGFGITVLEAMTVGVPVVAASRGALPEVLGGAGLLVDPEDRAQLSAAIRTLLDDPQRASACAAMGVARARQYSWSDTAGRVYDAYRLAMERRCASA